ncbi:uncharacterized protein BT62DRAFT_898171 [Guyanagaster necrorhizus]|uniref:Uncharacterized protein n=1 Tax=Guyanagaster necrorhizus TaxID=856835 RepID=A0A9P7VPT1_9AGAR|nr:uncharacterized protein BT62DRAFT_898171 [Guyanagaster necrorhizus MCA 3950]KAG7445168.1 hypothetical protein BT62DRAFT_898171 [Guyanagaster necrorhizus MCA 3950]
MDDTHAQNRVERLEVEEEDARIKRIEAVMHKLNTASDPRPPATTAKSFDFGERRTFAVDAPSELLSRVQAFLPQMEASNAILAQRVELDPKSVNIEHITEGMNQYIEMNLGLGVFEHHKDAQSQQGLDFQMGSSSSSESDEEDSSDTDTDSSSEIITSFLPSPRLIKPLPKRGLSGNKSPRIIVLGGQEFSESSSTC